MTLAVLYYIRYQNMSLKKCLHHYKTILSEEVEDLTFRLNNNNNN